MKTEKIQSSILTPKTTGYAALAGMGMTVVSGISKTKTLRKTHKPFAYLTGILSLLHVGLIEYYHYKYKKKSQ